MAKDLEERRYTQPEVRNIISIATILDPRNINDTYANPLSRSILIESTLQVNDIDNETQAESVEEIPTTSTSGASTPSTSKVVTPSTSRAGTPTSSNSRSSTPTLGTTTSPVNTESEKLKKYFRSLFKIRSNTSNESELSLRDKVIKEVDHYLNVLVTDIYDDNFDPITWWRSNYMNFPLLAKTVRHYLCIPATSVPSERAFSVANNVVTKKRNRLLPENVQLLTFLMNNHSYMFK